MKNYSKNSKYSFFIYQPDVKADFLLSILQLLFGPFPFIFHLISGISHIPQKVSVMKLFKMWSVAQWVGRSAIEEFDTQS